MSATRDRVTFRSADRYFGLLQQMLFFCFLLVTIWMGLSIHSSWKYAAIGAWWFGFFGIAVFIGRRYALTIHRSADSVAVQALGNDDISIPLNRIATTTFTSPYPLARYKLLTLILDDGSECRVKALSMGGWARRPRGAARAAEVAISELTGQRID